MSYDVVPYSPDLEAQVARLQTHLWSPDPEVNAAYLRWKYAENPFLPGMPITLALCNGRVVAMRGIFGAFWEADTAATRVVLPYADDFVVAPEHRNQGPASLVMRATLEDARRRGFQYLVSLSANPVTFVSSLAAGWRSAGDYQPVWRRRRVDSLMRRLGLRLRRTRWRRQSEAALDRIWARPLFERLDREGGGPRGPISLSREPRPAEMAGLVESLPWDGRIRHVRDLTYLSWRFRNPLHEYRFLYWDDRGFQGYLVLQRYRMREQDPGFVNLVDWEGSSDTVRAGLLEAALRWGRFHGIHTWEAGRDEPDRLLLRKHGFAPSRARDLESRSRGLLLCRLDPPSAGGPWMFGGRDLLNLADWELRMIYSMAG